MELNSYSHPNLREFSWERTQPSKLTERVRIPSPAPLKGVYLYKVYFTDSENKVGAFTFKSDEMMNALQKSAELRKSNCSFVTMVSENPDCVGQMGVDSIVDGKLPDGTNYEWKKRRK